MLSDSRHRMTAKLVALEALDVGNDELTSQVCILAHGVGDSGPSRLSDKVDLRMKCRADANGLVLFARNLSKLLDQRCIPQSCQAQRFGPLGELVRGEASADVVLSKVISNLDCDIG
jgi:hypothetical protein